LNKRVINHFGLKKQIFFYYALVSAQVARDSTIRLRTSARVRRKSAKHPRTSAELPRHPPNLRGHPRELRGITPNLRGRRGTFADIRRSCANIGATCGQPIFTAFALVADVSSMSLDKNQPPLFGKKEQLSVRAIALGYWLFKIND
jgi:hypothetical protein